MVKVSPDGFVDLSDADAAMVDYQNRTIALELACRNAGIDLRDRSPRTVTKDTGAEEDEEPTEEDGETNNRPREQASTKAPTMYQQRA